MTLPEVLRDVRRLGIDTSPLIYLVERHATYFDQVMLVMRHIHGGALEGVGSLLALTEVLVHPLRQGNRTLAREYEDILLNSAGFRLIPVDVAVARCAAELRAAHNLRTPDALHVATAVEADCDAFLTNDRSLKRVHELRVLTLDDLKQD